MQWNTPPFGDAGGDAPMGLGGVKLMPRPGRPGGPLPTAVPPSSSAAPQPYLHAAPLQPAHPTPAPMGYGAPPGAPPPPQPAKTPLPLQRAKPVPFCPAQPQGRATPPPAPSSSGKPSRKSVEVIDLISDDSGADTPVVKPSTRPARREANSRPAAAAAAQPTAPPPPRRAAGGAAAKTRQTAQADPIQDFGGDDRMPWPAVPQQQQQQQQHQAPPQGFAPAGSFGAPPLLRTPAAPAPSPAPLPAPAAGGGTLGGLDLGGFVPAFKLGAQAPSGAAGTAFLAECNAKAAAMMNGSGGGGGSKRKAAAASGDYAPPTPREPKAKRGRKAEGGKGSGRGRSSAPKVYEPCHWVTEGGRRCLYVAGKKMQGGKAYAYWQGFKKQEEAKAAGGGGAAEGAPPAVAPARKPAKKAAKRGAAKKPAAAPKPTGGFATLTGVCGPPVTVKRSAVSTVHYGQGCESAFAGADEAEVEWEA